MTDQPATSRPPGYAIGHITVRDPAKWREYCSGVPATLRPFGGEVVFRGALRQVFHGDHAHANTVVIRFPDVAAVSAWHGSEAYQALIPLRNEAADVTLLGFDTPANTPPPQSLSGTNHEPRL